MNPKAKKLSPLGEVLESFFTRSGWRSRLNEQKVLDSWRKAVGKGIGEQTQPIRIQNRVLQVRVSNSVWMQQLQFMKKMILKKIQEETGAEGLEDLRFLIGEVSGEGENADPVARWEEGPSREWEKLSEAEMGRIRREVADLADPEMRKIFEGIFARSFALDKSLRTRGK
jgi:hypothetical protein